MIHIVCVNKGNYCGAGRRYVETLHAMVARNISAATPYSFICFTDDETPYAAPIQQRPLPPGLKGWFNKLYLFEAGLFPPDDLILFLDLDTLITGPLDPILQYQGNFAILRDFYRPQGFGSGVMMWRGTANAHLWRNYQEAGFPEIGGGDQIWIEKNRPEKVDLLQDIFPGRIFSFKAHSRDAMPNGAAIVCFHGLPRPHEVQSGWVPLVWQIKTDAAAAAPPTITETPEAAFWKAEGTRHIVPPIGRKDPEGFPPGEYIKKFFIGCDRVTEIGCGIGRLAGAFEPDRYTGMDINPAAIEIAAKAHPHHGFAQISEADPFPETDGMLFYTVLLHVNDSALPALLGKAATAARRIVIAEIMDRRWRRGGNPPVYNREAEDYTTLLNALGFALITSERRPYERYNNEKWWAAKDTRLTTLVFERTTQLDRPIQRDAATSISTKIHDWARDFLTTGRDRIIFVANNPALPDGIVESLEIRPHDAIVQFNKASFFETFKNVDCHKVHVFNYGAGKWWGFSSEEQPSHDYLDQSSESLTFLFRNYLSPGVKAFLASHKDVANGGLINPKDFPNSSYSEGKSPSIGFVTISYFRYLNTLRFLMSIPPLELVMLGFSGKYPPGKAWNGHDFKLEQRVYDTWLELRRIENSPVV